MDETRPAGKPEDQIGLTGQVILAETLVTQYYGYLYRLAVSILEDPQEADDAVQETILRALEHWQDCPETAKRRGWLTVLAVNHCRDRLRRKKTRQKLAGVLQTLHLVKSGEPPVEELVNRRRRRSELWQAVQALDEKHRLPIIMRFINGMTAVEIAEALQISEGTVYSRLHYAIHHLRERLGPAFEDGGPQ